MGGLGVYAGATTRRGWLLVFFIGSGEWVNTDTTMFVERFASAIRTFRQDTSWFFLLELAASFTLSALQSAEPLHIIGCGHIKAFSAVVFLALLLLESILWPHCRFRDSCFGVVANGLQCTAMALMAAGYYSEDETFWTFRIATSLLFVTPWTRNDITRVMTR